MASLPQRNIGKSGIKSSAMGLGCMSFSGVYGASDDTAAIALIHEALDRGVTMLDSSDAYGKGHNEELLGKALKGRRNGVVLATKFGNVRGEDGSFKGVCGRPDYVRSACEASLRRLQTDHIDLYQIHHSDPVTPLDETMRALDDLIRQGMVRYVGVSNWEAWKIAKANGIDATNYAGGCQSFNPGRANSFLVDYAGNGTYTKVNLSAADLGFDKAKRTYLALDFSLEHALRNNWYGKLTYTLSYSKGQRLRLGAERRFSLGEFALTPRLSATWMDSHYVDYYYGVRSNEVIPGRAAYAAGSTVNTELGLRVDYRIAPEQVLFADVSATALGSAIKNSPLVDRSTLPGVRLGWLYRF